MHFPSFLTCVARRLSLALLAVLLGVGTLARAQQHSSALPACIAPPAECAVVAQVTVAWQAFLHHLQAKQTDEALSLLAPGLRGRFPPAKLNPQFVANVREFHVIEVLLPGIARAAVVRQTPEGDRLFYVLFGQDSKGRWLITEL